MIGVKLGLSCGFEVYHVPKINFHFRNVIIFIWHTTHINTKSERLFIYNPWYEKSIPIVLNTKTAYFELQNLLF